MGIGNCELAITRMEDSTERLESTYLLSAQDVLVGSMTEYRISVLVQQLAYTEIIRISQPVMECCTDHRTRNTEPGLASSSIQIISARLFRTYHNRTEGHPNKLRDTREREKANSRTLIFDPRS